MKPNRGFRVVLCLLLSRSCSIAFPIICLLTCHVSYGQQALDIGDKVPDVTFHDVINSSKPISLNDYRGKLLIVDFWATWCTPCISLMPKTDSLQRVFDGEVQFLPVTYQSRAAVKKMLDRLPELSDIRLPFVIGDTILNKLFPHKYLPHYVWIDHEGNVIAITGFQEVTGENIRKVLTKKIAQLEEKRDVIIPYNRKLPLLLNDLGIENEDIHYTTIFTRHKQGLSSRRDVLRYPDGSFQRITFTNMSFRGICSVAFGTPDYFFHSNRVILEVNDLSPFRMPDSDSRAEKEEWSHHYRYCYEIKVPKHLSAEVQTIMRQDIKRLFPQYSVSVEKRNVKCLVLIRTSNKDKIKAKGERSQMSFDATGLVIANRSLAVFISYLNGGPLQRLSTPVIDATGYSGRVDLFLQGDLSDVETIRKGLKAYDLDMVEKHMDIDMLVIRDAE